MSAPAEPQPWGLWIMHCGNLDPHERHEHVATAYQYTSVSGSTQYRAVTRLVLCYGVER